MNYRRTFVWGCASAVAIAFITGAMFGASRLMYFYGCITIGALVLSIILSGAMLSGDRLRANFNTENAEDRERRDRLVVNILLFAFPYALIAAALYVT